MMYALRPLAVASLMLAGACGDPLATGGFRPAFIKIKGTISSSSVAVLPANVAVALLWQNDQSGMNYTAQHVTVNAEFPASFTLEVNEAPKPQVIHSLPPDPNATGGVFGLDAEMRWALGTLVVYAD